MTTLPSLEPRLEVAGSSSHRERSDRMKEERTKRGDERPSSMKKVGDVVAVASKHNTKSKQSSSTTTSRCRSADRSVKSKSSTRSTPAGVSSSVSSYSVAPSSASRRETIRRSKSSDDGVAMRGMKRNHHHQTTRELPSSSECTSNSDHNLTRSGLGSSTIDGAKLGRDNNRHSEARRGGKQKPSRNTSSMSTTSATTEPLESSIRFNASLSSSLVSSHNVKVKNRFDVDAPRQPLLVRKVSDESVTRNPHSSDANLSGLTDEQRAWVGIEELLAGDDNASIATRDVLPDEIVQAMSSNFSYSTLNQSICSVPDRRSTLATVSAKSSTKPSRNSKGSRNSRCSRSSSNSNPKKSSTKREATRATVQTTNSIRENSEHDGSDHDEEDEEDEDSATNQIMMPGCPRVDPTTSNIPALLDASFSSVRTDKSKQSIITTTTIINNYVIPNGALAQEPQSLAAQQGRSNNTTGAGMQQFMNHLCGAQQQQQQQHHHHQPQQQPQQAPQTQRVRDSQSKSTVPAQQRRAPNLQSSNAAAPSQQPLVEEESIDILAGTDADPVMGESHHHESSEHEYDEEDDDDDQSRILIEQYTRSGGAKRSSTHGGGVSSSSHHRRAHVPELMDASFSSVQTEMTGILSLISTAKNYVVQVDDINPMGVFLGNITRNLERKQVASQSFDCEDDRIQYMSERDEIADERRKILEEEVERYQNGEYDDYYDENYDDLYYEEEPQDQEANDVEGESMPSLTSIQEYDDISPLPSPLSNRSTPSQKRRMKPQPLASDWRAWVDSAFQQAQAQQMQSNNMMAQQQQQQSRPTSYDFSHDIAFQENFAHDQRPPARASHMGTKVQKKRPKPSHPAPPQQREPPRKAFPGTVEPLSDYYSKANVVTTKDDEVISLSQLRVPVSSVTLTPSDLPSALPLERQPHVQPKSPTSRFLKKKDKAYQQHMREHKSPLVSLRSRMSKLYNFGVKGRRGSPASVLDGGRGDEARFFPTIDEEEEEDWGTLLPS